MSRRGVLGLVLTGLAVTQGLPPVPAAFPLGVAPVDEAVLGVTAPPPGRWGNSVDPEPNTFLDIPTWIEQAAPARGASVVVFDLVLVEPGVGNPNTAYTGNPSPRYRAFAYFGVWRDCNEDRYIGSAALGMIVYPDTLLADQKTACGDHRSGSATGGVVHELKWFVPPTAALGPDRITSLSAPPKVWADVGLPGGDVSHAWTVLPLEGGSFDDTRRLSEAVMRNGGTTVPWAPIPGGELVEDRVRREQDASTRPLGVDACGRTSGVPRWDDSFVGAVNRTEDCGAGLCDACETHVAEEVQGRPLVGPREGDLKTAPDLVLSFLEAKSDPVTLLPRADADPSRAGTGVLCETCAGWWSGAFTLVTPTLHADDANVGQEWAPSASPSPDPYIVGYASVPNERYIRYGLFVGNYGSHWCDTDLNARTNGGFVCDADAWAATPEAVRRGIFAGTEYHHKDTDYVNYVGKPRGEARDVDRDGLADEWERQWGIANDLGDLDLDGAGVLKEFRWGTIPIPLPGPFARDLDVDGWLDGPEIDYWDAEDNTPEFLLARHVGEAIQDPDRLADHDGDGLATVADPDSDDDGLLDGEEIHVYRTFPEHADSDCQPRARQCSDSRTPLRTPRGGGSGHGDGIPDAEEILYWEALRGEGAWQHDCDGDTIPNILDSDSDADGLLDGEERSPPPGRQETDPCDPDADKDGLKDGEEAAWRTDPHDADTDDDGMPDGWEARHLLRPTESDAHLDDDGDGLQNLQEMHAGSHPRKVDTDLDRLDDFQEVLRAGTDPARWDTDRDGMPDGWELDHGFDPRNLDGDHDPDGDASTDEDLPYVHTNVNEYAYGRPAGWDESVLGPWLRGTDPWDPDTDGDGMNDGTEFARGRDATGVTPDARARDPDQDGIPTGDEIRAGLRPDRADTDGDGICDGGGAPACRHPARGDAPGERDYRTSPFHPDSDEDGVPDGEEAWMYDGAGTGYAGDADGDGIRDLWDPDADDDGLSDLDEIRVYGTDARRVDTDGDGLSDAEEIFHAMGGRRLSPTDPDTDGDLLPDGLELLHLGTDPLRADTDMDGLDDGAEHRLGTDPFHPDTDRDRMPDGYEVDHRLDPLRDDAFEDLDRDAKVTGLFNLDEYLLGTAPDDEDSDDDGLNDHWEVLVGLDPLADDRHIDPDGDGLTNALEYLYGTKPHLRDTDGDGLEDGWEVGDAIGLPVTVAFRSDPRLRDTDGDGLDDGREVAAWALLGPDAWRLDHDGDDPPLPGRSNLRDADSDNDGLDDGTEALLLGTRPDLADTDGDGDDDRVEVMVLGTDPTDPASNRSAASDAGDVDQDGDGLGATAEARYGTRDDDPDSDRDGMRDGAERLAWGKRVLEDYDGDGAVSNLADPDSDGDGLLDAEEFASAGRDRRQFYLTSPALFDTDGDAIPDGEEDHNGMRAQHEDHEPPRGALDEVPRLWLATFRPPDVWWDGEVESGRFVEGAFGLRLILRPDQVAPPKAEHESTTGPQGARSARGSSDLPDTDHDGIPDAAERGPCASSPRSGDSDGDGILDRNEPAGDSDGDGCDDRRDTDSDDDGLPDGEEDQDRDGQWRGAETNARDADTDDDGLCDGPEKRGTTRTSPTNPDTDGDGIPDGRELWRKEPCGKWTADATLKTGLPTFRKAEGEPPTTGPNAAGLLPQEALDFDGDGLLDGLEDFDLDGLQGERETKWWNADSDGDGILDSVELHAWGGTLDVWLLEFKSLAAIQDAIAFKAGQVHKTNPDVPDTDADGIFDLQDLDPNGLAPTLLTFVFDELSVLDPIDPPLSGFSRYSPEPWFRITISTAAGDVVIETDELPEVPLAKPTSRVGMGGVLTAGVMAGRTGGLDERVTIDEPGRVKLALPESVASYRVNDELLCVTLRVHLGDVDLRGKDASDTLDLNGESSVSNDYQAKYCFGSDLRSPAESAVRRLPLADGSADEAGWTTAPSNAHDDARLSIHVVDSIRIGFAKRAANQYLHPTSSVVAPRGVSFG